MLLCCEEALKHTEVFVRRVDLAQNAQLRSDQEALGYPVAFLQGCTDAGVRGQEELAHFARLENN